MRQLVQAGLDGSDVVVIDSLTAQKRLVEAGLGIALLSENNAAEELRYGTIAAIGVRDLNASHDVVTVTRRGGFSECGGAAVAGDNWQGIFAVSYRHSGMVRRTRPGISRFRVRASHAPE